MQTARVPQWSLRTFLLATTMLAVVTAWAVQTYTATGVSGEILGPTTAGSETAIRPPHLTQVVACLRQTDSPDRALPPEFRVTRMSSRLIRSHSDPAKMVPLLGMSVLHHHVYRCTLHGTLNGKPEQLTFEVDQQHFHMVDSPSRPNRRTSNEAVSR